MSSPYPQQTIPPSVALPGLKHWFQRPGTLQGSDDRAAMAARLCPNSPGSIVALGARGQAIGLCSSMHWWKREQGKPGQGGSPARSCLASQHFPGYFGQRTKCRLCARLHVGEAGDAPASQNANRPRHSSLSDVRGDPVAAGCLPGLLTRCGPVSGSSACRAAAPQLFRNGDPWLCPVQ